MKASLSLWLALRSGTSAQAVGRPAKRIVRSIFADPTRTPIPPGTGVSGEDPEVISYGDVNKPIRSSPTEGLRSNADRADLKEGQRPAESRMYDMKGSAFTAGSAPGKVGIPPITEEMKTSADTGEPLAGEEQDMMGGAEKAEQKAAWRALRAEKGQAFAQRESPNRDRE